jgi:hypothetical protein
MTSGSMVYTIWIFFLTPISFGVMAVVTWWFIKRWQEKPPDRTTLIWQHHSNWGETLCRQLIAYQLDVGMTAEMVTLSWGQPARIAETPKGQIWHYPGLTENTPAHVTLKDGLVIGVEGQPKTASTELNPYLIIAFLLGLSAVSCTVVMLVLLFI